MSWAIGASLNVEQAWDLLLAGFGARGCSEPRFKEVAGLSSNPPPCQDMPKSLLLPY